MKPILAVIALVCLLVPGVSAQNLDCTVLNTSPRIMECREKGSHLRRVLTAVPRAAGRAVANMVTFRDPLVAAQQWALVSAVAWDAHSTTRSVAACQTRCREKNAWLYGRRPQGPRLRLAAGAVALTHVTITQAANEALRGEAWPVSRLTPVLAYSGPITVGHYLAGRSNLNLAARCERAELQCN